MQQTIKIDIRLPINIGDKIKHLSSKSYYDNNYYELPTYGDWIGYGADNNNILFERYNEEWNCYTYHFGRFENEEYISVLSFAADEDILNGIAIKDE